MGWDFAERCFAFLAHWTVILTDACLGVMISVKVWSVRKYSIPALFNDL
jgi:hypothetical protein